MKYGLIDCDYLFNDITLQLIPNVKFFWMETSEMYDHFKIKITSNTIIKLDDTLSIHSNAITFRCIRNDEIIKSVNHAQQDIIVSIAPLDQQVETFHRLLLFLHCQHKLVIMKI